MTAVLGGDRDEVLAKLAEYGLTPANDNGPGQIVAAGTVEELAALAADPPAKARLIPLSVAGAFHTRHMEPAVQTLAKYATADQHPRPADPAALEPRRPRRRRRPGRPAAARRPGELAGPLGPVHADHDRPRGDRHPRAAAGGHPVRIARRDLKGVETFALKTPDQLDDARAFVEHGSPSEIDASPTWRLLVAPIKGTFTRKVDVLRESGATVEAGEVVAKVASLRDEVDVTAPHGGIVVEWLVEEGDPVAPGQPLVRLHPAGSNA